MNRAAKTETGNNPEWNKDMNYDDRYEITTINRPAVRLTALVMALPVLLVALAGAADRAAKRKPAMMEGK